MEEANCTLSSLHFLNIRRPLGGRLTIRWMVRASAEWKKNAICFKISVEVIFKASLLMNSSRLSLSESDFL